MKKKSKVPEPNFIKTFRKRLYKQVKNDPNAIQLEDKTIISLDPD